MLQLALFLVAADPTVTLDVKLGGDIRWKEPCTAEVMEGDKEIASTPDVSKPMPVPVGKYDVVIACATADEGTVKKVLPLTVREDNITVKASFDPGFLLVNVMRFDTPTAAEVTILDERGFEIAKGKERAVILVEPGRVRVVAKVDDKGRTVFGNTGATIVSRKKIEATVDTTDGELTVFLTDNGKKTGGVAALRQPGQKTRIVELRAGEKGTVPPGTYDLVTQLEDAHDFSEVLTKGVVIQPSKPTTKTVAHRTGIVKPRVLVDGKTVSDPSKIEIELYVPGATQPFNTVALGDALKLAPGKVQILARQKEGSLDDGTGPAAEQVVNVPAGGSTGVTLDLAPAKLDVAVTLGKKPAPLDVSLVLVGAEAPAAKKKAGADGKVSFALSPGKYNVKAALKAQQGDVVTQKQVTLRSGSSMGVKLDLDVGTAVVQVFEGGVSVPAEVRFFEQLKDGKPDGDPVLAVPAGAEAILPPGTYALVVVRKASYRVFSDLKVAAGRTVERTVDLSAK
jgi:hypothetical protein